MGHCHLLSVTSLPCILNLSCPRTCSLTAPVIPFFIQQYSWCCHCLSSILDLGVQQGTRQVFAWVNVTAWGLASSLGPLGSFLIILPCIGHGESPSCQVRIHCPLSFLQETVPTNPLRRCGFLFGSSEIWEFGRESQHELKAVSALCLSTYFPWAGFLL